MRDLRVSSWLELVEALYDIPTGPTSSIEALPTSHGGLEPASCGWAVTIRTLKGRCSEAFGNTLSLARFLPGRSGRCYQWPSTMACPPGFWTGPSHLEGV